MVDDQLLSKEDSSQLLHCGVIPGSSINRLTLDTYFLVFPSVIFVVFASVSEYYSRGR